VDIEKEGEETIVSKPIKDWKVNELELHKKPAIFIIGYVKVFAFFTSTTY